MNLVRRRLTPEEAACLHRELKTTPNILGYTARELLGFTDAIVAMGETDDELAGVCLSKDLWGGWTDIAVLYVLPRFRGTGLSSRLYGAALDDARERKRHVYTLSRSPQVIHLMKRHGLKLSGSFLAAPLAVQLYMNAHMMSLYRWREAVRKSPLRALDSNHFVSGTLRFKGG